MNNNHYDIVEDKKLVILLLALLYFTLMTVPAQAWTVYDVGSQSLIKENIGNYNNWPYDIRRQCVVEQSRAVLECSKSGFQNWIVFQTIVGKGTYKNKKVSMFYEGYISGNYECDPPETREENGFLVDDLIHINSRIVDKEVKSIGKKNSMQYSHFVCEFSCQAWNCAERSLKEKLAEERPDLKKEKIFCIKGIFSEGITSQEKEFLKAGWVSDDKKKKLEIRQKASEWKVTGWWWGWYNLLEKLCKNKSKECKLLQIYEKETRLKELVPDDEFWGYYGEEYTGEKLVEYCWYCDCWNLKKFPKTTLRENDLERAKKLLEKYEKCDIFQTKIDSLIQEEYTIPSYLKDKKVNFVIYDSNNELATAGINFGEKVEIEEGGLKDANIICEAQFEEVANLKTLNELIGIAENKCRGTDFFTDITLNIGKFFKGITEIFS